ncbi:MAG: HU family DNA-binding protein [Planctomycetota bacterium]
MAKKAAKKTAKRTTKKAPARAAAAPKAPRITSAKDKARTKSEILTMLAEHTGISKKEVAQVFEVMGTMIAADLKKGAIGSFTVPGLMKVTVQRKPATKARKGINPFTKEPTVFAAKPARNVVKVRPMKGLKDLVG